MKSYLDSLPPREPPIGICHNCKQPIRKGERPYVRKGDKIMHIWDSDVYCRDSTIYDNLGKTPTKEEIRIHIKYLKAYENSMREIQKKKESKCTFEKGSIINGKF